MKQEDYRLENRWKSFAVKVLPDTKEDSIQYKEMRKAFMSGIVDHAAVIDYVLRKYSLHTAAIMHACNLNKSNMDEFREHVAAMIKVSTST